jgi:hypothetical protein
MYSAVASVPGAWTLWICKRWKLLIHCNLPLCGIAREGVLEYARGSDNQVCELVVSMLVMHLAWILQRRFCLACILQ